MTPETLRALRTSITHWEENLTVNSPDDVDYGSDSCALCAHFIQNNCEGCPVEEKTGQWRCQDSPYEDVLKAIETWEENPTVENSKKVKIAVQAELDFLKSLLPQ